MVTPGDRSHGSREDRLTLRCTALVGVCAAALNFSALSALAAAADYPHWLVWCYPVCVDAYGLTAARVWLRGVHSAGVTRWARGSSVFVLVISMAAAGLHAFTADGRLPTTLGFGVSTLPALMLGLAVHLLVLVRTDALRAPDEAPAHATPQDDDPAVEVSAPPLHVEPAIRRAAVAAAPVRRGGKRQAARAFYDAEIGGADARGSTALGALLARRFDVHDATGRQWVTAFRREDAAQPTVNGLHVLRGTS